MVGFTGGMGGGKLGSLLHFSHISKTSCLSLANGEKSGSFSQHERLGSTLLITGGMFPPLFATRLGRCKPFTNVTMMNTKPAKQIISKIIYSLHRDLFFHFIHYLGDCFVSD